MLTHPREVMGRLYGLGLHIDLRHGEVFIRYLQREMKTAPLADLASSSGWVRDSVFALPNGNVFGDWKGEGGPGPERELPVYYHGQTAGHNYATAGTFAAYKETAHLAQGNSRLILPACMSFTGPLMQDAGEPSGGVNSFGPSSKGKTTAAIFGGSACGGGDPQLGFGASWRSTPNGLEPLFVAHNHGTVFLDELHQADPKDVGPIIYQFANSSGKRRMTRDLSAAPTLRWRGMLYSTGESSILAYCESKGIRLPGGAAVRLLDVPAIAHPTYGVFEDLHGRASSAALSDEIQRSALSNYGWALPAFLEQLTDFTPEERRELIGAYREQFLSRCKLAGACAEVVRAAKRLSVVAAAGCIAVSFGILPWSHGTAIEGVAECFFAWLNARGGSRMAHDAAVALGLVRGFLERFGASRFEPVTRRGRRASAMPPIQDQAGYVRRVSSTEDEYLFSPIVFRTQVAKELDANFVLKSLEEHGYLNKQGKNRTVSTKIFGQPKTLYSVSSRILEGA